jgi:glycerate kinase
MLKRHALQLDELINYVATMRVLIAPDKFKGSLTAQQAAKAIARGWGRVRPRDDIELLPVSDGGDGFGSVLAGLRPLQPVRTATVNAAGRRCQARWWWDATEKTAVIESAGAIGLAKLPPGRFHPFELDTRGLAALLHAAARRGAKRCLIGVGGSATNDAGFGLARSLGWRFLEKDGTPIERWRNLDRLTSLVPPPSRVWPAELLVAVDVQNPLLGPLGCTRIYGPQKGLRPQDFREAEKSLRRLAEVTGQFLGRDLATTGGAGAAGGLGFGLAAFAGAKLTPGFELVAQAAGLKARLRRADLVITGEGRIDSSSLMGKTTGELAGRCKTAGVPCIALAGEIQDRKALTKKFAGLAALTDLTTPSQARKAASEWLEKLAAQTAKYFSARRKLEQPRPLTKYNRSGRSSSPGSPHYFC